MKKIIILDFASAQVYVYPYDENIYSDYEDWLSDTEDDAPNALRKHRSSECQCMIVPELIITIV